MDEALASLQSAELPCLGCQDFSPDLSRDLQRLDESWAPVSVCSSRCVSKTMLILARPVRF